jgi:hypothetical protein
MPCLLAVLAVMFPRIVIVVLFLFTNYFTGMFPESVLIPVAGFLFMPVTLLGYTYLTKQNQPVDAFFLVVMIVAVVLDLGLLGGGERARRKK